MMGIPPLLKCFLAITILLSLLWHGLAQNQEERDALYALKARFNNRFLNQSWSGPQCSMDWYGVRCVNGRVSSIVLENRGLRGVLPGDAFVAFTELTNLSLRNNFISGNVMNFFSNQKLKQIDLSGNRFYGSISRSLLGINLLESLQLQDNNLTGPVLEFNQPGLKIFNVSDNDLSGQIPLTDTLQKFHEDSFLNNPELCGPPTSNICGDRGTNDTLPDPNKNSTDTSSSSSNKGGSGFNLATMFALFDIVGLIAVILLFVLYFKKVNQFKEMVKKHNGEGRKEKEEDEDEESDWLVPDDSKSSKNLESYNSAVQGKAVIAGGEQGSGKLIFMEEEAFFELKDLLKASAEGLGKGIFGNTYKAVMEGGPAIVVKRLRDLKPLTIEEFTKQLHAIADQKHPNLFPLLAYYYSNDEKLMVYRYADKGNLFNRIHGGRGKDRIPFRWSARLSVARGVARALEYLHTNNKSQSIVPHGNLKSSNVLINENDMVLVSDYGLASLIAQPIAAQRMVSYKSPEYQGSKRVSKKSDVWSYGSLLLELLTGRVSAHSAPGGANGVDICSWVHRAVREEWTAEIFDTEISVQRSAIPGMLKLLQIAMRCCDNSPDKRPEMTEVVRDVENIKAVESENEEDLSVDQSLTDESISTTGSATVGDERSR